MAYYWVTEAQKYIRSLGLGVTRRAIGNGPIRIRINQFGQDNAFESDHPRLEIRFGKGGVDDAEDAEVILHEYGHAIHDSQHFSFATEEAGAISEGFGDYWAVTVGDVVATKLGVPESGAAAVCRRLGLDLLHERRPLNGGDGAGPLRERGGEQGQNGVRGQENPPLA
jgi:hypothetical protein